MATVLADDRNTALRVGYAATDWSVPVDFEDYAAAMKPWTIRAIVRDGECIGAVFRRDDEVHVSVLPKWRGVWATKGLLRQILNGPRVTTKVSQGHDHMYGILGRLGFKSGENGSLIKGN